MARNSHKGTGKPPVMVTCAQTGAEVSRRQSLAVDYKGDGKCGSPAPKCKRISRHLAPKKEVIHVYSEVKNTPQTKVAPKDLVSPPVKKAISSREKSQMRKLLEKKRNEDKKST